MAQTNQPPPIAPKPKRRSSSLRNVMMKSKIGDALMVVALDIGTSYTGYAYSTKGEFNENPLKISTNNQWHGSRRTTMKCPTILLVTPEQNFHSFGYAAMDHYKRLIEDDKENSTDHHHQWGYFSGFKMHLHHDQNLNRNSKVDAANGMLLPAIVVFRMTIEFLRSHLLKSLNVQAIQMKESEILWVLTVPALWSDAAKQMMRTAAVEAGIEHDRLILALEPETAAIYCHLDYSKRQEESCQTDEESFNKPGNQMILCDLGGGTADISVLEVQSDGKMKQIYEPGGGPWGGTTVEAEILCLFNDLIGANVMHKFAENFPEEYLNLKEELETGKRALTSQQDSTSDDRMTMHLPSDLKSVYEDIYPLEKFEKLLELQRNKKYRGKMKILAGKLVILGEFLHKMFRPSLEGILGYLNQVFSDPNIRSDIVILLVGGFSASFIMEQEIKRALSSKMVVVPRDAELSVVKGAVMFGHNSCMICQRIVRHTYGVNFAPDFKEGEHDPEKKYTDRDGNILCKDVFSKFVERGQAIKPDEPIIGLYYPNTQQTSMSFNVYESNIASPVYVTDRNCSEIGKLDVPMPDVARGKKRTVLLEMLFGETEIKVRARLDDSDETIEAVLSCLDNILV